MLRGEGWCFRLTSQFGWAGGRITGLESKGEMNRHALQHDTKTCLVCGGNEFRYLYTPPLSPGPVMVCRSCGFTFIPTIVDDKAIISDGPVMSNLPENAKISHNLADIQGSWELPILQLKEREYPAMRYNTRKAIHRLARYTHPGRILDFGCGGGFQLNVAGEEGWQGEGLEPLTGHAIYARAKFGVRVVNDVLHDDTFAPETFDAITAFQVFEHLPDPEREVKRLIKALKPGGALLIEVPNIDNLLCKILGPRHRHFVADHLNFFSPATLKRLMEKCGLQVVSVQFPSRLMSIEHLIDWITRLTPIAKPLERFGKNPKIGTHMVSVNLHDIIEVIGVKPTM